MHSFSTFIVIVCCVVIPSLSHAEGSYYSLHRSTRRGSEVHRTLAAASFTWERIYGLHSDRRGFICSLQNLLPANRGAGFLATVSAAIAQISHQDATAFRIALLTTDCAPLPKAKPPLTPRTTMTIDIYGRVISSNPVWNACIRGAPLRADFIRTNTDVVLRRQGSIRVRRILSCRDYHKGDIRVWEYPDDPSVELYLDQRGRLLGDPPKGYVLKTRKYIHD